jgi:spoIIIJ-associated protein
VSAKTVTEAIAEAEQRLGLPRDEIDITIISEGSKGFLGMGGENARILAMPRAILARRLTEQPRIQPRPVAPEVGIEDEPVEPAPLPASQGRRRPVAAPEPARAPEPAVTPTFEDALEEEEEEDQPAAVRADPAMVAEVAVEVVRELIVRMGLDAMATVRNTGNPVVIDITGDDLGLLIGRHGDTLSALQYLVNAIVGRRVHRWCKVVIDVEHYRLRREDTLRSLANRQAARVRQSRQEITLDPMPAAERRVVHMTLQNNPWVATHSVGEEPNRCVVISPRQASR